MDNENKIRKVLFNEVSFTLAIVGVVLSSVFWIMNPQKTLEMQVVKLQSQIESNQTIAKALEDIKSNDLHEFQLRLDQIESRQIEILKSIAVLDALLRQHIQK